MKLSRSALRNRAGLVLDRFRKSAPRPVGVPRTSSAGHPCCNICGGTEFGSINGRSNVHCQGCGSVERTRVMMAVMQSRLRVVPGMAILHIAPELGLSRFFKDFPRVDYQAVDLAPELYRHTRVRRMDLVNEAEDLPSKAFDVVFHSHVMEHIPSNVSAVLLHLHRALKPGGLHIFSVPIFGGRYEECLADIGDAERVRRFRQDDHVRRFGRDDIQLTIGKLFKIPAQYDLRRDYPMIDLAAINVPEAAAIGYSSSAVFCLEKEDCRFAI